MAVALVRAVAQEGTKVVLDVRKKPNDPPMQIRVDSQQLPADLASSLSTGEVKIEDGFGKIMMIQNRGRNAQIVVDPEHMSGYNITGWFDTTDPSFETLQTGQRIGYRVVVRRKVDSLTRQPMVDPSVGILDVSNDVKVRDMTYCGDPALLPPIVPGATINHAFVPPAPPLTPSPAPTYRLPSMTKQPVGGVWTPERCNWCGRPQDECTCGFPDELTQKEVNQLTPKQQAQVMCNHGIPTSAHCPHCLGLVSPTVRNDQQRSFQSQPQAGNVPVANQPDSAGAVPVPPQGVTSSRPVGARREEGKPWVLVNTDGSLNLGSYAFDGIVECEALAVELCEEYRQQTRQAAGDRELIRKTTKALMLAADLAQASIREDGRHDAMDTSHKRARYCVRMASKRLLPPFEGRAEDWRLYAHALGEHASMLLQIAVDIFKDREGVR